MEQSILNYLLERQAQLDEEICKKRYVKPPQSCQTDADRDDWLQALTDALGDEVQELKAETNWKWWKDDEPLDHAAIKYELIDILHFWLGACNTMDMNAQEIIDLYESKNKENKERQQPGGRYA